MDFLDYQTFSVVDADINETTDNSLPEPVQRLNLSSVSTDFQLQNNKDFQISESLLTQSSKNNDKILNLHEKMAQYAALSIDNFTVTSNKETNTETYPLVDITEGKNQNVEATNLVLSKKLSKILNDYSFSNYQSTAQLRKALQSLEDNRTILSLDEDKLNNPDYIGSLARKSLRADLETELLKEHLTVLDEFRPIVRRIKRLSKSIENIKDIGDSIINNDKDETVDVEKSVLTKVDTLRQNMENLRFKKTLLNSIRNKFTLSQVEEDLITNGSINEEFFQIINKVMKIKESTTYILSLPNDKAGEALITQVNNTLELLNKKIFNFLVDFLYSCETNSEDKLFAPNDYSLLLFQRSLIYLSNDLTYFDEFLKRVTTLRSRNVLDQFLSQFDLNSKDSNPIILSAHDPVRYIGDVLANVHSLIANEADFVKSLFKFQDKHMENTPISVLQQNNDFLNGLDLKLLNESVQSLSNSCRIRIEQIVRFEQNPITNFEIVQLLNLYQLMFERKGIQEDSTIVINLKSLAEISKEKILEYFTNFINEVNEKQYEPTSDLLPPDWLSEYLGKIVELFESYEKTIDDNSNDDDEGNGDDENDLINYDFLQKVIEHPIKDVLLVKLKNAFPLAKKNEQIKSSMFTIQINCYDLIKTRLQPFKNNIFTKNDKNLAIFTQLTDKFNEIVTQMQILQNKFLFDNTGLGLYSNLLNMIFPVASIQDELDYDMYLSLSENALMELDTIDKNVHDRLNDYLPQALDDIQGNLLFKITSPVIADQISDDCFNNLSHFYKSFRRILLHLYPDSKERISEILNFSEEDFNMLIGVEEN